MIWSRFHFGEGALRLHRIGVLSETVGNTGADQPRIKLGLAADFRAASQSGIELRFEEELLHVEVHAPMFR